MSAGLAPLMILQCAASSYIGFNADRGHEDEMWARIEYSKHIAPVTQMGFITNSRWASPSATRPTA